MTDRIPVAIVGSGITGLCIGRALHEFGAGCLIFDKGRYPGGRMASFVHDGIAIDYGPNWFHTRDEILDSDLRQALIDVGAITVDRSELPGDVISRLPAADSVTSWKIPGGLRSLASRLAEPLEIRQRHQVRRIERHGEGWRIHGTDESDGSRPFSFDAGSVILTMPWPQVLELLRESGITPAKDSLPPEVSEQCYDRIHVGTFLVERSPLSPSDSESVQCTNPAPLQRIDWVEPPGQSDRQIVTAFADPEWSRHHFDDAPESVMRDLVEALRLQFGKPLQASVLRHHRWKFARLADPQAGNPKPLVLSDEPPLIVAGEAFGVRSNSPAGLLSAQASAAMTFRLLTAGDSGRSGLA